MHTFWFGGSFWIAGSSKMLKQMALIAAMSVVMTSTGFTQTFDETVESTKPESVAKALLDSGFRAKLTVDSEGDPKIDSSSGGVKFQIFFYGCTKNKDCTSVQFNAGFSQSKKTELTAMNEFNNDYRFGKAYLNKRGNPTLKMDIDMHPIGISHEIFEDYVERWETILARFTKKIDW